MAPQKVHLLLIAEDKEEAAIVSGALQRHGVTMPITLVHNYDDALQMVQGQGGYKCFPRPYIILLETDSSAGIAFLKQLRSSPDARASVVFFLTSRNDDEFKSLAYDCHVAGYLVKTMSDCWPERFAALLNAYCSVVVLLESFLPAISDQESDGRES